MRPRTAAGGFALGGALLLALALAGGGPGPSAHSGDPVPERLGPRTAVQPARPPSPPVENPDRTRRVIAAIPPRGSEPAPAEPVADGVTAVDPCRALFEDPASLTTRWGIPAAESFTHTDPEWAIRQALALLPPDRADTGFARLRELATDCGRVTIRLDGTPVTLRLRQPGGDLPRPAGTDASYAMRVAAEPADPPLVGWLVLDRVGPVVSVLWQLAPATDADRRHLELALHARRAAVAWWSALRPGQGAAGPGTG